MARDYGAATPGRLISSAKSWLCHTGVDRTAELLPWHAASDVERISPVEASSRYLAHIRAAWNERFKSEPLERQDVVLTLPASFDEIARELTVQAAARAGLPRVVLIEEPQAAFYAWIYKHQDNWEQLVSPGQKILVCDIGGGTTDFTLIRVRRGERRQGAVPSRRRRRSPDPRRRQPGPGAGAASGRRSSAGEASSSRGSGTCCCAQPAGRRSNCWPTMGRSKLTVSVARQRLEADRRQRCRRKSRATKCGSCWSKASCRASRLTDKPAARRSGFQEFGLPYAADPAITRYLAAFLTAHRHAGEEAGVRGRESGVRDGVAIRRGRMWCCSMAACLSRASCGSGCSIRLADWFRRTSRAPSPEPPSPTVLDNDRLDLAVARGAAYYGMVRRGEGVKIVAALARTYYIGVESRSRAPSPDLGPAALCLVPGSAEPGQDIELADRQFDLLVSEPVEFPLYTSSIRLTDQPGELVPVDPEQMTALPPIRTVLKTTQPPRARHGAGAICTPG